MLRSMLFIGALVFSLEAFAGSYRFHFYKPMPELMTYQELAMLPKPKRIEYLKGIRQLLTDMQRLNRTTKKQFGKDAKKHAELDLFEEKVSELLAHFSFLPEAVAAEPVPAADEGSKPILPYLKADGSIACANGGRTYFYYPALGTCGHKRITDSCPGAHDAAFKVTGADGRVTNYCVPAEAKSGMLTENLNSLNAGKPVALPRVADDTPADAITDPIDNAKVVANATNESPSAFTTALADYAKANGGSPTLYDTGTHELYNGASWADPKTMTADQIATLKKEGGHIGCSYDEKSFKRSDELRKKISDSGIGNCVMGGSFSYYNSDGGVRKGNCVPVTKFPKDASEGALQCTGARQQLCNPLLYCTTYSKAEGAAAPGPICVSLGEELTANCDAEMKKIETASGVKCDPFDPVFGVPAVQNEWKNFMVDFNLLCNPSGSFVEFFCKECQLMSARVKAITLAAKGRRDAAPDHKDTNGPGEFDHLLGTPDEVIPDVKPAEGAH